MGIARSTCYRASKGSADDTALVEAMHAIKDEFEAYGWRRMQAALRHRGCAMPHWILREPQCGQYGPSGQRSAVNHASAASSVGNIRKSRSRDRPSRYDFPGPLLIDPVAILLLYCNPHYPDDHVI